MREGHIGKAQEKIRAGKDVFVQSEGPADDEIDGACAGHHQAVYLLGKRHAIQLFAFNSEPDASGRRRPVEIPGSEFTLELDTVIMALGTSPNPLISSTTEGLETNKRKCIVASEENGQTSKAAVFAGGDAVTGAATVILAMGAGKAGAKGIDEYLSGK